MKMRNEHCAEAAARRRRLPGVPTKKENVNIVNKNNNIITCLNGDHDGSTGRSLLTVQTTPNIMVVALIE